MSSDANVNVHAGADRIDIIGLRGRGRHGVFDFERAEGQEFVVDITIFPRVGVFTVAAASDDIDDAVDYAGISAMVLSHITGPAVNLIETLAARIAADAVDSERIAHVCVTVHKPQAPLTMEFSDVSVTVHRDGRA